MGNSLLWKSPSSERSVSVFRKSSYSPFTIKNSLSSWAIPETQTQLLQWNAAENQNVLSQQTSPHRTIYRPCRCQLPPVEQFQQQWLEKDPCVLTLLRADWSVSTQTPPAIPSALPKYCRTQNGKSRRIREDRLAAAPRRYYSLRRIQKQYLSLLRMMQV